MANFSQGVHRTDKSLKNDRYNPFPGLRSFKPSDTHLFFGREKQMAELLRKLRATRFLAILGNSGSGKSSMVKCGLLPHLQKGFVAQAGADWRIVSFRPGIDPIGNMSWELAKANAEAQGEAMEPSTPAQIEAILKSGTLGLVRQFERSEMKSGENLLLVIDQFEELFKYNEREKKSGDNSNDALVFVNLLLTAAKQQNLPLYIVITMRSDFLGNSTEFRGLPEIINEGQFLVPRMQRDEIKRAITGPLALVGVGMAPRLTNQLLNDVGEKPDELPILQHTLNRLFEQWENEGEEEALIDIKHYDKIGTISHALDWHAEEAYNELVSKRDQQICERIFKAITDKGSEGKGTSRPTKMSDLIFLTDSSMNEIGEILRPFIQEGRTFVSLSDTDVDDETIVSLSHESLMRVWKRLSVWVDDEFVSSDMYSRMANAATLHYAGQSALWRNPELQLGLNWYESHNPNKVWANRYGFNYNRTIDFLMESRSSYENEKKLEKDARSQKLQRARRISYASIIALLICLSFAIGAYFFFVKAQESAVKAEKAKVEANEGMLEARLAGIEANEEKRRANEEKKNAVIAAAEAEEAKTDAEEAQEKEAAAAEEAVEAKTAAEAAAAEAEEAKTAAEAAAKVAKEAQVSEAAAAEKAQVAQVNAQNLKFLEESQGLAIKSEEMEEPMVQGLLAEVAYLMVPDKMDDGTGNKISDAKVYDTYVYNGLYSAINSIWKGDDYNKKDKFYNDYNANNKHIGDISKLINLSDGKILSIGRDGKMYKWDKKKSENVSLTDKGLSYTNAVASPNKKWLASLDLKNEVRFHKVAKLEDFPVPIEYEDNQSERKSITSMIFLKNNKDFIFTTYDNRTATSQLYKASIPSSSEKNSISKPFGKPLENIRINAFCETKISGKNIFILGTEKGGIYRWDLGSEDKEPQKIDDNGKFKYEQITALCDVGNNTIIVGTQTGRLYLFDLSGEAELIQIANRHYSTITSFKLGGNYNDLLISTSWDKSAKLWRLSEILNKENQKRYVPIELPHSDWVMTADFVTGIEVITGSRNGEIRVWPTMASILSSQLEGKMKGNVKESDIEELKVEVNIVDDEYKDSNIKEDLIKFHGELLIDD
ncbi:MAG: energy-coupling factor transporter ATP-binding protein EcfA2 [Maribacter sp.]|jgi:energy-coupling factor transporter ATP-binding protein EcfA2